MLIRSAFSTTLSSAALNLLFSRLNSPCSASLSSVGEMHLGGPTLDSIWYVPVSHAMGDPELDTMQGLASPTLSRGKGPPLNLLVALCLMQPRMLLLVAKTHC